MTGRLSVWGLSADLERHDVPWLGGRSCGRRGRLRCRSRIFLCWWIVPRVASAPGVALAVAANLGPRARRWCRSRSAPVGLPDWRIWARSEARGGYDPGAAQEAAAKLGPARSSGSTPPKDLTALYRFAREADLLSSASPARRRPYRRWGSCGGPRSWTAAGRPWCALYRGGSRAPVAPRRLEWVARSGAGRTTPCPSCWRRRGRRSCSSIRRPKAAARSIRLPTCGVPRALRCAGLTLKDFFRSARKEVSPRTVPRQACMPRLLDRPPWAAAAVSPLAPRSAAPWQVPPLAASNGERRSAPRASMPLASTASESVNDRS